MGRKVNMDLLEKKIEKAQGDVVKTKKEYDKATKTLKDLLDKRDSSLRCFFRSLKFMLPHLRNNMP